MSGPPNQNRSSKENREKWRRSETWNMSLKKHHIDSIVVQWIAFNEYSTFKIEITVQASECLKNSKFESTHKSTTCVTDNVAVSWLRQRWLWFTQCSVQWKLHKEHENDSRRIVVIVRQKMPVCNVRKSKKTSTNRIHFESWFSLKVWLLFFGYPQLVSSIGILRLYSQMVFSIGSPLCPSGTHSWVTLSESLITSEHD